MTKHMTYTQAIWLGLIGSFLICVLVIWVIDLKHRMERLEERFGQNRKWWHK